MRVGIDARFLDFPGVGRYIHSVISGLTAQANKIDLVVYTTPGVELPWNNIETRAVPFPIFSIREQFSWPSEISKAGLDLFHAPHYVAPLLSRKKLVVTIHDLVYFHFPPTNFPLAPARLYYSFMNHLAARKAAAIITVSEFTRNEVVKHLGVPPDLVHVVHNAVSPTMQPQALSICRKAIEKYNLPRRFVLYLGTNKPWKNLLTVLKACAATRKEIPDLTLVIAGKRGRNEDDPEALVREYGLQECAVSIGPIEEADLPAVYTSATMVVLPSLYEGFGLTALEALACGTPVIASNRASLPEVVHNSAILLEPADTDQWSEAIASLWQDHALQHSYSQAGLEHVKKFSVEKLASQTAEVYSGANPARITIDHG